jgi:hypothetical protein
MKISFFSYNTRVYTPQLQGLYTIGREAINMLGQYQVKPLVPGATSLGKENVSEILVYWSSGDLLEVYRMDVERVNPLLISRSSHKYTLDVVCQYRSENNLETMLSSI